MLSLFSVESRTLVFFFGLLLTLIFNFVLLARLKEKLPHDLGRAFAVNAGAAKGKPRGAGIIFILAFFIFALLLTDFSLERLIYLVMIVAAMMTGFLDDASNKPWGELKKGLCDFAIALICAITYVYFNPATMTFLLFNTTVTIPSWLYVILAIILVWASINVTNCTDGVDGLSSSLTIVVLLSFYAVYQYVGADANMASMTLIFLCCIIPYLWFNCSPSIMLMGDAGSRAIGLFFAIIAMKSGCPTAFVPLAFVFVVDGGLGLLKVSLLRYLKIRILKNTRTPLHDNARKNHDWSDTQTVTRFVLLQCIVTTVYLFFSFVRPF